MSARPRHRPLVALTLLALAASAPPVARAQALDLDDAPPKASPAPRLPPRPPQQQAPQAVAPDDVPPKASAPPRPPAPPPPPVLQLDDPEVAPHVGPTLWLPPDARYPLPGWEAPRELPRVAPPRRRGLAPDDPRRTPRRYRLLAAGAVTLAGTYLATVTVGSFIGKEPLWAVPLVGPVLVTQKPNGGALTGTAILVTGAQLTGVVLTAVGLGVGLKRDPKATDRRPALSWSVAPILGPDVAGAGAWGSF